ncbi:hypothetical protein H5410_004568 [Solanum commersonii]|uniref:Uncharacterized protein n=1 Tax=Solanum commersonii TaxID=4109 RepID=A0A9J6B8C8_SOLCO|nr:hypothetical protein H5410_004568 [Solanum commersonii]
MGRVVSSTFSSTASLVYFRKVNKALRLPLFLDHGVYHHSNSIRRIRILVGNLSNTGQELPLDELSSILFPIWFPRVASFSYTASTAERLININLFNMRRKVRSLFRSLSSNPQMCIFEVFHRSPISQDQYFGRSSCSTYLKNELTERLFTEIVVVSVIARISHDWVGVKSTACLDYALHEHLNVQDKKNEGKNLRGECSRRENRDGKSLTEMEKAMIKSP